MPVAAMFVGIGQFEVRVFALGLERYRHAVVDDGLVIEALIAVGACPVEIGGGKSPGQKRNRLAEIGDRLVVEPRVGIGDAAMVVVGGKVRRGGLDLPAGFQLGGVEFNFPGA